MKKKYFIDVLDRLEKAVPALRWIDADEGQLNFTDSRPAVAFPACLVDILLPGCENMAGNVPVVQKVELQINLKIAFNDCASFSTKSPVKVREKAAERYDILEDIHKALQGWRMGNALKGFSRKSVHTEKRPDGLKVFNCVYTATLIDKPE